MFGHELTHPRPEHVGLVLAGLYSITMFWLGGVVWYSSRLENHGMDWLGFALLTLPGSAIASVFHMPTVPTLISGIAVNAFVLYIFGILVTRIAYKLAKEPLPLARARHPVQ